MAKGTITGTKNVIQIACYFDEELFAQINALAHRRAEVSGNRPTFSGTVDTLVREALNARAAKAEAAKATRTPSEQRTGATHLTGDDPVPDPSETADQYLGRIEAQRAHHGRR